MKRAWRLFVLLLAFSGTAWAQAHQTVGYLTEAAPDAVLIRGSQVYAAEPGVGVEADDVLRTGPGGGAQLEMLDGTLLQAGPASQLHLAQYALAGNAVESADVSLVRGWLRFLTARLAPGRRFQYTTPTMTIGIRGTAGVLEAGEDSAALALDEGEVEIREWDADGQLSAPRPLRGGEFIERRQGQRAQWRPQHPEDWRQRLPAPLRERPSARLGQLRQRDVALRHLRAARDEDVRDLLHANPRDREHFRKRFEERLKDPHFRKAPRGAGRRHGAWDGQPQRQRDEWHTRRVGKPVDADGPGDRPGWRGPVRRRDDDEYRAGPGDDGDPSGRPRWQPRQERAHPPPRAVSPHRPGHPASGPAHARPPHGRGQP